eukprot:GEMP01032716.1.p1 GENE.GEMP01032716.1~~GEMP01032716.1.p1  ORF type:complete len:557 (+),score=115.63 GEMP01032716.1:88-1758(+)
MDKSSIAKQAPRVTMLTPLWEKFSTCCDRVKSIASGDTKADSDREELHMAIELLKADLAEHKEKYRTYCKENTYRVNCLERQLLQRSSGQNQATHVDTLNECAAAEKPTAVPSSVRASLSNHGRAAPPLPTQPTKNSDSATLQIDAQKIRETRSSGSDDKRDDGDAAALRKCGHDLQSAHRGEGHRSSLNDAMEGRARKEDVNKENMIPGNEKDASPKFGGKEVSSQTSGAKEFFPSTSEAVESGPEQKSAVEVEGSPQYSPSAPKSHNDGKETDVVRQQASGLTSSQKTLPRKPQRVHLPAKQADVLTVSSTTDDCSTTTGIASLSTASIRQQSTDKVNGTVRQSSNASNNIPRKNSKPGNLFGAPTQREPASSVANDRPQLSPRNSSDASEPSTTVTVPQSQLNEHLHSPTESTLHAASPHKAQSPTRGSTFDAGVQELLDHMQAVLSWVISATPKEDQPRHRAHPSSSTALGAPKLPPFPADPRARAAAQQIAAYFFQHKHKLNDNQRKKVFREMLLSWHPDKVNPDMKEFPAVKEVFQWFNHGDVKRFWLGK